MQAAADVQCPSPNRQRVSQASLCFSENALTAAVAIYHPMLSRHTMYCTRLATVGSCTPVVQRVREPLLGEIGLAKGSEELRAIDLYVYAHCESKMANAAVILTTDACSSVLLSLCVLLRAKSSASITADVVDLNLVASASCSPPAQQLHVRRSCFAKWSHPSQTMDNTERLRIFGHEQ